MKKLHRSFAAIVGTKGVSILLLFSIQVLLAREMGVSAFGVYSYLVSLGTLFGVFCLWGLDKHIIKKIAPAIDENNWNATFTTLTGSYKVYFLNLIVVTLILLLGSNIGAFALLDTDNVLSVVALLASIGLLRISTALTKALGRVVLSEFMFNVLRPLLFIVIISVLIITDSSLSPVLLVVMLAISYVLANIASSYYNFKRTCPAQNRVVGKVKVVYSSAWLFFIIGVGTPMLSNLDILVLGYFVKSYDVAQYAVASKVANLVLIGLVSANLLIAPKLPVFFGKNQIDKIFNIVRENNQLIVLMTLVPLLTLLIWPALFLSIFGEDYKSASNILRVLLLGQVVNVMCGPVMLIGMMCDLRMDVTRSLLVSCVVLLLLSVFLVPLLGLYGAAIASVLAYSLNNFYLVFTIRSKLGFDPSAMNLFQKNHTYG